MTVITDNNMGTCYDRFKNGYDCIENLAIGNALYKFNSDRFAESLNQIRSDHPGFRFILIK